MKKSVRLMVAVFAALVATTMAFTGCSKKGAAAWKTNYETAKKSASRQHKNMFLLFSGDDWDGKSQSFKENIGNTDEFTKTIGKDYILVNLDFSQTEYAKANVDDTKATDKEKKAAGKIKTLYDEKNRIANLYRIQSYPSMYIVTSDGYVIANLPYDEKVTVPADYIKTVAAKKADCNDFNELVKNVKKAKKLDRVKAIDALYTKTDPSYAALLGDLIREVPELDKNNETKLLGKYEMQVAYLDATEKVQSQDVEAASQIFVDLCDKGHLEAKDKQDAYYLAAYVLAAGQSTDYDKMIELMNKAIEVNPTGETVGQIQQTIEAVKTMQAYQQKEGPAEAPSSTSPSVSDTTPSKK